MVYILPNSDMFPLKRSHKNYKNHSNQEKKLTWNINMNTIVEHCVRLYSLLDYGYKGCQVTD
jgi:hypothetical protein